MHDATRLATPHGPELSVWQRKAALLAVGGLAMQTLLCSAPAVAQSNASNVPPNATSAQQSTGASSAKINASAAGQTSETETSAADIVVTAQKRPEQLLSVPVPVTVLNTATLAQRNLVLIQDYFSTVPGLGLISGNDGGGTQSITLRGLSTSSYTNSTAAVVIDDVPFGSASGNTFGNAIVPDLDPGDLSRIEVLKGPQGTLYGADALARPIHDVGGFALGSRPAGLAA